MTKLFLALFISIYSIPSFSQLEWNICIKPGYSPYLGFFKNEILEESHPGMLQTDWDNKRHVRLEGVRNPSVTQCQLEVTLFRWREWTLGFAGFYAGASACSLVAFLSDSTTSATPNGKFSQLGVLSFAQNLQIGAVFYRELYKSDKCVFKIGFSPAVLYNNTGFVEFHPFTYTLPEGTFEIVEQHHNASEEKDFNFVTQLKTEFIFYNRKKKPVVGFAPSLQIGYNTIHHLYSTYRLTNYNYIAKTKSTSRSSGIYFTIFYPIQLTKTQP